MQRVIRWQDLFENIVGRQTETNIELGAQRSPKDRDGGGEREGNRNGEEGISLKRQRQDRVPGRKFRCGDRLVDEFDTSTVVKLKRERTIEDCTGMTGQ